MATSGSASVDGGKGSGGLRQYYVAVGSTDVKMQTLIDLLLAMQANGPHRLAVVCSSRDSLDLLISSLAPIKSVAVHAMHSDMDDENRKRVLSSFLTAASTPAMPAISGSAPITAPAGAEGPQEGRATSDRAEQENATETSAEQGESQPAVVRQPPPQPAAQVLATTDVCLKAAEGQQQSLGLQLLISYDLPARKELYTRRLSMVLGSRGPRIAVQFVVAGEMAGFRALEGFAGSSTIDIMPVHVADIVSGTAT
ncbi:hypothetical protein WJX72_004629 [[Myrmecia] bisecta]|uniref:Uncharacterized protein n=1 Tax=[Myrmecia] bisecta TaxID=41462 RepID=A0AAW1PQB8_9CHLO